MNRREAFRRQRESRARRATAHHEAGHAVMAWALGLKIQSVSIRRQGNSGGHVLLDVPPWVSRPGPVTVELRLFAEANIMSQMSGFIAERRYRGRANHVGAAFDYVSTHEIASALTFSREERDLFLDWLFARARALMRRRTARAAVTAVARALLKQEEVSGRAVARLANQARERGSARGLLRHRTKPQHPLASSPQDRQQAGVNIGYRCRAAQ